MPIRLTDELQAMRCRGTSNRFVCWLFKRVWWRWMSESTVHSVTGWRTARVSEPGIPMRRVACCFWIFD